MCNRFITSSGRSYRRETNDSAAVLKVLYIYCILNKNTLKEIIIFQHVQDMEILRLSTAVSFDTGTYFNKSVNMMGAGGSILCKPVQTSHSTEGSTQGRRHFPRAGPICDSPQGKLGEDIRQFTAQGPFS